MSLQIPRDALVQRMSSTFTLQVSFPHSHSDDTTGPVEYQVPLAVSASLVVESLS